MPKAKLRLRGRVKMRVTAPDGRVKHTEEGQNLVTTVGQNRYAAILESNDGSTQEPTHTGLGDDDTAVLMADTALGNEHGAPEVRAAITSGVSNNEVTYTTQHTAVNAIDVKEVGIFDQLAVGGNMFARYLTTGFELEAGDVLDIEWTLTVGD